MKKIAIFIPAYNEENTVGTAVLLSKKYGEVFVVDDGSVDRTAEVARNAGARVISLGENLGYGAAITAAIAQARKTGATASVFLDADMQHNPDDIPRIAAPVLEGRSDVCLGSRFSGKFVDAPVGRRTGVTLVNALFGVKNSNGKTLDAQCGFRAFSKKANATVSSTNSDFSAGAEFISSARKNGLRIVEVPVEVKYYRGRETSPLSQAAGLIEYAVGLGARKKPLAYFCGAGAVLIALSALVGVNVVETFYSGGSLMVGSALLSVFMGIGGLALVLIGINLYTLQMLMKSGRQ
ncbi:MAG: glycosyltransferase family 2 protein [Candidatus Micrarchaeota archaeon]|nr:glycosyltransferase family 2 protein [Candidatus Micrarchaeota archaeon]